MAHIHLAWELGGGLGHAARLRALAQVLLARDHQVSLSLRDLGHTRPVLAGLPVPVLQAPVWLHRTVGMPPNQASLAEILIPCGYLEASALDGLVAGWRSLLVAVGADLLVTDYAPTALLAARSMALPCASLGLGFYNPPLGQALPNLRPWEDIGERRLAAAELHVLQVANAVLRHYAASPYARAAEILQGDSVLLTTWPELDHYQRAADSVTWYGPLCLAQTGAAPVWPDGNGPKVFAYFKQEYQQQSGVLQALVEEGCRVLCYVPELSAGAAPPLQSPAIRYTQAPVSLPLAMAEAHLCVCHAGEATLVQALLAGVPLLLLPLQLEQFLVALRVESGGAGMNGARLPQPADWRSAVRRLLGDGRYRTAAHAFANNYRSTHPHDLQGRLADQLEKLLANPD
jgi:UDP:flavonoid glycosyltransferase YjiC (YdhE family)